VQTPDPQPAASAFAGTPSSTSAPDDLAVHFIAQGEQSARQVATWVADFIAGATRTLDFAVYDFHLNPALAPTVIDALRERAAAGVGIRIAYDAGRLPSHVPPPAIPPPPPGTEEFVQALGFPARGIGGMKLMHQKYVVRDAGLPSAAVWTGSTNFTDDSWTACDNNIVTMRSPVLAAGYARDFEQMWQTGTFEASGGFDTPAVTLTYAGEPARADVLFSPGCGPAIDYLVAQRVAGARRRVRLCTMLINSSALIAALTDLLNFGRVPVDGVYDRTQMQGVYQDWQQVRHNRWKIGAVEHIIAAAHLVGKDSTPYSPTSVHDFMHNKVLLVDDTVITGSYNFSRSAELNAENIVFIESPALAEAYSAYIDHLEQKYGGN
jgi:phosphatidylserine/phosphatidylglycerophosphate/cardiolipin synthase-like enzyme